jgi:hypothetical protein
MIVGAGDLVSALILLTVLEGFRRVGPDEVVIAKWRGAWTCGSSSSALWFRSIGWLWLAPHFGARTFVCRSGQPVPDTVPKLAVDDVRDRIAKISNISPKLRILTLTQALLIFFILPAVAVFGHRLFIYCGMAVVLLTGSAMAAMLFKTRGFEAMKYALYPPASLLAVAENSIIGLQDCDFDAVVTAMLPDEATVAVLRRHYRSSCFGPGSDISQRERVELRVAEFAKLRKLDAQRIIGQPNPSSATVLTYCPCCEAEFVLARGVCPDCGGVELVRFEQVAAH